MSVAPSAALTSAHPTRTFSTGAATLVDGLDGLRAIARDLASLHARSGAPATVRTPWLFAGLGRDDDERPWAVAVRDRSGALAAAAVLITSTGPDADHVTLAGGGFGHRGELVATTPTAGAVLGTALAERLSSWPGPVRVALGPLDAGSVAARALVRELPGSWLEVVDPVPVVRVVERDGADVRTVDTYLSASVRRTLRKAANRLARDGHSMTVRFSRDAVQVTRMLPTLEALHRGRDRDRGRESELDDPAYRLVWHARMRALAAEHSLELATAHVDGELAAYVLGIPDEPAYRVLEGHLATEWARYAPGRVLEAAVLQRVLDDKAYDVLDWMTSVASESLLAANGEQEVVVVRRG